MDMPQIGLGTYLVRGSDGINAIKDVLILGYRHIDTARMYGNEKEVGQAIKESGINREEIFITTKICSPDTTYDRTYNAVLDSLKNLDTKYIDLVLIHEPYENSCEMYKALETLVKEGKIHHIGVSNFNKKELLNILQNCDILPYANQIELHLFYQQEDYVRFLQEKGIRVIAWSPLCQDPKIIINNLVVREIAKKHKKSEVQIALKFLLQRGIYIIPKSKERTRQEENIDLFDFTLDEDDMIKLKLIDENESKFGWYY